MMFRKILVAPFALTMLLTACSKPQTTADIKVSDVDHSAVKRQSIGNCWLYAVGTWAESLHKTTTGQEINLSETYWTYWHFYDQMVNSYISEVETGGHWGISRDIIMNHGYMLENEFIPGEESDEMSATQAAAEAIINASLASGGELESTWDRSPENVRKVLDQAFGVNMTEAESRAYNSDSLVVGQDGASSISLYDAVSGYSTYSWSSVSYPTVSMTPSTYTTERRNEIMKRAMRAVNDHQPVVLSLLIDFNALDTEDGMFKYQNLLDAGTMGKQGGHMVVMEDYAVVNAPDGQGGTMSIGEGDLSAEMKAAALQGQIDYIVTKNSWGTNRPDRGLTDGYTRFDAAYLDLPHALEHGGDQSSLNQFILPPGY